MQQHQQQQQQLNSYLSTSSNASTKPLETTTNSANSSIVNDFDLKQAQKHKQAIRLQHQANQPNQHQQQQSPIILHQSLNNKTSSPLIEAKNANKKSFTKQLNPFKSGNNAAPTTTTNTNTSTTTTNNNNNNTSVSQGQMQPQPSPIISSNANHHSKNHEEMLVNELEVSEINDLEVNGGHFKSNSNGNNGQSKQVSDAQSNSTSKQIGLDQFNLIKVIGRGSYAKVFLVEYKKSRKCYAMKVIKKSIVDDDEDIDWVQTEKHVFEQATNHPFLVGLHSCFQTESRLFFVIEYLCGGDLMYHMQRKRRLPEDHARFAIITLILRIIKE